MEYGLLQCGALIINTLITLCDKNTIWSIQHAQKPRTILLLVLWWTQIDIYLLWHEYNGTSALNQHPDSLGVKSFSLLSLLVWAISIFVSYSSHRVHVVNNYFGIVTVSCPCPKPPLTLSIPSIFTINPIFPGVSINQAKGRIVFIWRVRICHDSSEWILNMTVSIVRSQSTFVNSWIFCISIVTSPK